MRTTKTRNWQAVKFCLFLFAVLNSYLAQSSQSGAFICFGQAASLHGGQSLVLDANYILNYDPRRVEEGDSTPVFEQIDSPSLREQLINSGINPNTCKAINISQLTEQFPTLQTIIHTFQSSQGAQLAQGYKIIAIPHENTPHKNNAGISARLSPALAAGVIAMLLTNWWAPGYSTTAAAVAGFACFAKPEHCFTLFNSAVGFVSGFLNKPHQSKKTSFTGVGRALGRSLENENTGQRFTDNDAVRNSRVKRFETNSNLVGT